MSYGLISYTATNLTVGIVIALGLTMSAQAQSVDTDTSQFTQATLQSVPLRLAALDSIDGPPPCGKDGACNAVVCNNDPDCPVDMPDINTNSPDPNAVDPEDELVLRVQFNLTEEVDSDPTRRAEALVKINAWIDEAEAIFKKLPRLKIKPYYKYGTINVPPSFKDVKAAKRFLKDHYDNIVGDNKGEGKLVVAVTSGKTRLYGNPDNANDNDTFAGLAYFPDSVKPLALKHGIVLMYERPAASFAHELGHIFGLPHTDSKDGSIFNVSCNGNFSDKTTRKGKRVNLMDGFGLEDGDDVWLNACQKDKAADHRERLLTKDGKTNYKKL